MKVSRGVKLAAAVIGIVWLLGRNADARLTLTTSSGKRIAKHTTYEGDVGAWAKARYKLAHDYFAKYWSAALDADGIKDAALSVLAHWSLETGAGTSEANFNVGNIRAVGSQAWFALGDYNPKTGGKGLYQFASYDTLQDGVDAYFGLLENSNYSSCLDMLVSHPTDAAWFKCIGQKGYYAATLKDPKTGKSKDNLEPAAAGWASRRALLAQYATADVTGDMGPLFVVSDPSGADVVNYDGSHAGVTLEQGTHFEVNVRRSSDELVALGPVVDGFTLGALVGRYVHGDVVKPAK